jgi:DNA-binding SARP family transcriptional activator
MEFRILGPLEVVAGGRTVALGSRERALLALLLLSANQVVSSERLVEDVWAGQPPEGATRALRVYISRLRKALADAGGDGTVVTRTPGYLIRVEPDALDADRFHALLAQGRSEAAEDRHREAAETLRRALSLWRGAALGDLADAPFAQAEAARLEEARLAALEERLEADLVCGRHGEVLPELEALTRAQPLRERFWAQRMLALYRAGRQAEALRAYQHLRRLLGEELGIEPGADLSRLESAILRHEPALDLIAPPVERVAAPARRPEGVSLPLPPELAMESALPFVSRSAEVDLAEHVLSDPARQRLAVLWLLGEPGIGKTRLAAEFARRAHGGGAVVLFGRCSEDLSVPYQPFLEALRWFVAQFTDDELPDRLGEFPGELTRLLPELGARLPGLEAARSTNPEIEQYHLFEAIRSCLASDARPVVVVVDDVQWAGSPTLALLGHVARSAGQSRALLVCTARTTSPDDNEALAALADDLDRHGVPSHRLELGGLGVEEVGELVESAAGRSLDEGLRTLAAELQGETAGNPLFVEVMLASLPAPEAWRPGDLPRTLAGTIARRVARLPAEVADLLRVASVAGLDFDLRVAAQAAGLNELDALENLDHAVSAGLLEEAGPDRYRFAHALVRSALRSELSQSRRVRTHLRVGEALEAVHGRRSDEHAAELAHHFFEAVPAGGAVKAYDYAILAAKQATRLLSHHQAAEAYGRAAELLDSLPDDDPFRRVELLMARGEAEISAGHLVQARATLWTAAQEAATRNSAEHLAVAAVAFDRASAHVGFSGLDSLALARQAEATLPEDETPLRALTLAALGRALIFSGYRQEAVARGEEALAIAQRLGDPANIAQVLLRNIYAYRGVEHATDYSERASELTRLARELDDDELYLFASFGHEEAAACLGDLTTWDALLADQARLVHMIREPYCEHDVALRRYLRAAVAGDFEVAETFLQRAREIGGQLGWGLEGAYALGIFLLRREQGRLGGVDRALQEIVSQTGQAGVWGPGLAALYVELGELDEARRQFDRLAADSFSGVPHDGTRLLCVGLLAEVCAALGNAESAPWLLEQLRPCEQRLLVLFGTTACLGPTDRLLANLAAVIGDRAQAERWYDRALHMARGLPSPLWTAHCLHDFALHLRDTDPARAKSMLEEAAALCQRHDLVGLGRRVDSERAA